CRHRAVRQRPRLCLPFPGVAGDGRRGRRPEPGPGPPARARHAGRRHPAGGAVRRAADRKSTRLNSSHVKISYAVFGLKKKTTRVKYDASLAATNAKLPETDALKSAPRKCDTTGPSQQSKNRHNNGFPTLTHAMRDVTS